MGGPVLKKVFQEINFKVIKIFFPGEQDFLKH